MASGSSGVNSLELGIIGNGTVAGLVDGEGAMVWLCLPRLDLRQVLALAAAQAASHRPTFRKAA